MTRRAPGAYPRATGGSRPEVVELYPGVNLYLDSSEVNSAQEKALRNICDLVVVVGGFEVSRRAGSHRIGSVRCRTITIVVPPASIDVATIVGMIMYVAGVERLSDAPVLAELREIGKTDLLSAALGALLMAEAERVLGRHLAQGYVPRVEALQTIRGRPLFASSYLTRATSQLVCRHYSKDTNILPNQLLLAGIVIAMRTLPPGELRRRASRVRHMLLDLAEEPQQVRIYDFGRAFASLTRQTRHYSMALRLAQALIFGYGASSETSLSVASPVFDLAVLFEQYLSAVLRGAAPSYGLHVTLQDIDADALLDGAGKTYRRIRPDVLIWRGDQLRAVVDAKYKSAYVSGFAPLRSADKVSSADLYQLFFYSERLSRRYHPILPINSIIVAPSSGGKAVPDLGYRSVRWIDQQGAVSLQVLACDLPAMVMLSNAGSPVADVLAASPELRTALLSL